MLSLKKDATHVRIVAVQPVPKKHNKYERVESNKKNYRPRLNKESL